MEIKKFTITASDKPEPSSLDDYTVLHPETEMSQVMGLNSALEEIVSGVTERNGIHVGTSEPDYDFTSIWINPEEESLPDALQEAINSAKTDANKSQAWAEETGEYTLPSGSHSAKYWAEQSMMTSIPDGAITTAKLADNSVSTGKVIDGAITSNKLSTALNTNLTSLRTDIDQNSTDISSHTTQIGEINSSISSLSSGKVNKSGDTLTGALAFQGTNTVIKQTSDSGVVVIEGGTGRDLGARLSLAGKDFGNNNGTFWLTAHNGTDGYDLRGKVDGTLTWGGKNIDRVNDSGTGYIRYENGLQICWGVVDVTVNLTTSWGSIYETSSLTGTTYNYAKPFVSTPYITIGPSYENTVCIENINADANGLRLIYLYTFKSMSNYRFKGDYIAIGKWK